MSEIDQPYSIPAHWKYVRLGEVSKIIPGNSPPSETYNTSGEGVPLINGPVEFGDGPFQKTKRVKFTTEPTKECKRDDLLLCVRGSTTGRMNISGFDACIGRGVAAIRAGDKFDQSFLNYYVHFKQQHIFELGSGSTFPSVSKNDVSEIPIPLPPLPEQRDIVAKIEELFSNLDAGVDGLQTAQKQLERYRLSVLQAAVEGRLTAQWRQENPDIEPADELLERILEERHAGWLEQYRYERYDSKGKKPPRGWKERYKPPEAIKDGSDLRNLPNSWKWASLHHLCRWSNGDGLPKKDQDGGQFDVYGGNGVTGSHSEYMIDDDAIVVGRVGAHCGNVHLAPKKSWITDNAIYSKWKSSLVDDRFLLIQLRSIGLNKMAGGSGQPYISQKVLKSLPVAIPPLAEQREISNTVDRLLSVSQDADTTVMNETRRADRLRQSILKKAFSGKLVPHSEADGEVNGTASPSGDGVPPGTQTALDI